MSALGVMANKVTRIPNVSLVSQPDYCTATNTRQFTPRAAPSATSPVPAQRLRRSLVTVPIRPENRRTGTVIDFEKLSDGPSARKDLGVVTDSNRRFSRVLSLRAQYHAKLGRGT
jgi:hypothetical protein